MNADLTPPTLALTALQWVFIGVGGTVVLVIVLILGQFFSLWLQALLSNASVSFASLIGMRLRKVKPDVVVLNRISAKKAGLDFPTNQLE
ncbi:MAG: flotillin-like FloA family protein, partial [Planctomycetota bacterium]|nr:flotillin-like FloA family protein [Planctomycetota bacterium]